MVDIEFMEVLKDVGVIVIYGVWVNDGVVLVIIKWGKEGSICVEFLVKLGWNYFYNFYNFMNVCDYIYWMCIGYMNVYMGDMKYLDGLVV